jgi:hypothetical protein
MESMSNVVYLKPTEPVATTVETCLVFSNPGTLELDLVKLMGVSVKETADPIGFFGTGLKYAMATALRLGGNMTIFTNSQRYDVCGRQVKLRDKEFTQVMLNDEPLGFTTELGKQWEAWMVVRELFSNALDEQGETMLQSAEPSPESLAGRTAIVLRGECFITVWNNRQQYFLSQVESRVHASPFVDAFDALGHNHAVFYRGIKVFDTSLPTLYRYNLLGSAMLTEDRTLKYEFQLKEAIEMAIITSKDVTFIARSLTTGDYHYENYLAFTDAHSGIAMSDEFKSVCKKMNDRKPRNLNMAAIRWYQTRAKTFAPVIPVKLTKVQQAQLDKAVAFVKGLGFGDDFDSYEIVVTSWLGEGIYGQAKDGKSYISKECFDKGTKFLASTLLEEFVHNRYGLNDESRDLQTWLFDRIITMGEEYITGEPL